MRGRYYRYAMVVLVALITTPLLAQYTVYDAPPPKWDLYGAAGFDFQHSSISTHANSSTGSNGDRQLGGTVDATLHGFFSTPQFLDFGANVNDLQNAGSSNGSTGDLNLPGLDTRNSSMGWSAYANFLSGRGMPILVHYIKTDAGLTSSLFHTTQGTSEFGVTWRGKLAHLPWLAVDYRDSSADVAVPSSLLDTNNKQKDLILNAHDRFLGWNWNGNFTHLNQDVTSLGTTILPVAETTGATIEDFTIRRGFFDDLFKFSVGEQMTHQNTQGSLGTSKYKLFNYNSSLWYLPTDKLSAGISFYHDRITNDEFAPAAPGSPFTSIFVPSTTITAVTGTTIYRPARFLTLTGSVNYNDTFVPSISEQIEKTITPSLAGAVNRRWWGLDMSAHAMFGYRLTTSNLGRPANGPIDSFGATVSRGSLERIRYTGKAEYSHDILPQILGSYNNSRMAGLQAETMRWANWRLTAGVDYTQYDTLTVGGQFNNKSIGFHAGATRDRYGIRVFRTQNSGDGSIFPAALNINSYIIDLPLSTLIGSPLLNRTGNTTGVSGFFNWHRWIVNGSFTRENDLLSATEQKYNIVDITVRYTLGKFTLDAGYGRNVLNTGLPPLVSGTTFNRFRFRITRSFTIF